MSIFKNLKKSIGDGVNLLTLDNIVNDILQKHSKDLTGYVAARETPITEEEAVSVETNWDVKFNDSYDRRATEALGKQIPEDWKENKDIICVRKRILNRGLDKTRGQLRTMVDEHLAATVNSVKHAISAAKDSQELFVYDVTAKLPILATELDTMLAKNRDSLVATAYATSPNMEVLLKRFAETPGLSWVEFMQTVSQREVSLRALNQVAINKKLEENKDAALAKLVAAMTELFDKPEYQLFVDITSSSTAPTSSSVVFSELEIGKAKYDFAKLLQEKKAKVIEIMQAK